MLVSWFMIGSAVSGLSRMIFAMTIVADHLQVLSSAAFHVLVFQFHCWPTCGYLALLPTFYNLSTRLLVFTFAALTRAAVVAPLPPTAIPFLPPQQPLPSS